MCFSYTSVSSMSLAYAISGSYMSALNTYPWESSPHIYSQWSIAPHHDLAPLTILFCGRFSKIIFVGPRGLPCPPSNCRKDLKHLATFVTHHHRLWYHLLVERTPLWDSNWVSTKKKTPNWEVNNIYKKILDLKSLSLWVWPQLCYINYSLFLLLFKCEILLICVYPICSLDFLFNFFLIIYGFLCLSSFASRLHESF